MLDFKYKNLSSHYKRKEQQTVFMMLLEVHE